MLELEMVDKKYHNKQSGDDDETSSVQQQQQPEYAPVGPTEHLHLEPGDDEEEGTSSTPKRQQIGTLMLATIVFYNVSGGPFGIEATVRAGGNFYALLGFLIMPFIWSVPEAVMTAELGSAFPEAAGGVAWVEEAFGEGAAWMAGYLGWVAGATDNAIYPVLFLDYLLEVFKKNGNDDDQGLGRLVFIATAAIVLGYINWLGLSVVGNVTIVICVIAMSPFLVMVLVGAFQVHPSRWLRMPDPDLQAAEETDDGDVSGGFFASASFQGVLWRPFLNNLFWNLNSYDAAASFSEEVDTKIFARGMLWSCAMVVVCYFVPLLIALGASDAPQSEWVDGYLTEVASKIAGPWLGDWTVFAAGISNIAMFQAELSADAFQLMGMANRGHVPSFFAKRSRHGTPTYGIILGTIVILVFAGLSELSQLIEMLNFNYSISLLMEYSAFLKLRVSRPDLHRPWKLPFATWGCFLFLTPTYCFILLVLALADYSTYFFTIGVNLLGVLIYVARRRGWWSSVNQRQSSYDRVQSTISDEVASELT